MKPTQIELTAKRFKFLQILGVLGIAAGCVLLAMSIANGGEVHGITSIDSLIIVGASVGISYIGQILAWWFHG